jgi:hypothetical protein
VVYVFTVIGGLIALIHLLLKAGSNEILEMGIVWIFTGAFAIGIGGFLYAARLPERLAPGKFDIWVGFVFISNISLYLQN